MYTAVKGDGAYLNGERIYAAPRPFIESIAASGGFSLSPELLAQQKKLIAVLPEKIMRMRMFGVACAGFAFAAAGRIQCFITAAKNKWDICPGILLAREAGCAVSGVDERFDSVDDFLIVGANEETCGTVSGLMTK
jgi:myo-inositol-1(or 4)-monophosphatase